MKQFFPIFIGTILYHLQLEPLLSTFCKTSMFTTSQSVQWALLSSQRQQQPSSSMDYSCCWRLQARKNLVPRLHLASPYRVSLQIISRLFICKEAQKVARSDISYSMVRCGVQWQWPRHYHWATIEILASFCRQSSKEFLRQIYYDSFMFDV